MSEPVRAEKVGRDLYGHLYLVVEAHCAACHETGPVKVNLEPGCERHFCLVCGESVYPAKEAA